jgi:hypothetical protein
LKKPAGKNKVMKLPELVDIAVLGVNVNATVAAFAKMRSESAMVIENCVGRVPDAYESVRSPLTPAVMRSESADVKTSKVLLVLALPTVSPPIVMVKLLLGAMLAPDIVMIMRLLPPGGAKGIGAKVANSPGMLQESMVGILPIISSA